MKPTPAEIARAVVARNVAAPASLAVGLSGGMDSVALLDALSPPPKGVAVSACHVNHAVSPRADAWARFCKNVCAARGIPFVVFHADSFGPPPRRPAEEALRAIRLRAFARMKTDFVALAHHADDQNETALFRLLRGAGLAGLAAMREVAPLQGMRSVFVLRPFLRIPRSEILAHARMRRLAWVEDEDNLNLARKRNFLRRKILPLAACAFPNAGKSPGAVATRLAESADLLRTLAVLDSQAASGNKNNADGLEGPNGLDGPDGLEGPDGSEGPDGLEKSDGSDGSEEGWELGKLRELGAGRVANLLHSELSEMGSPPAERATREAARQIVSARPGARLVFAFGRHRLASREGRLAWVGRVGRGGKKTGRG